jgi:arabinan endo-1,5-alpha-L-arabinosidase
LARRCYDRLMRMVRLFAAALLACSGQGSSAADLALDQDFPDPAVLKAPDGFYYAYATQGGGPGAMRNIQVARSRDLKQWQPVGDALPAKPGWASKTQDFWAPHVLRDGSRYYLYYSAKPDSALSDDKQGLCLAVATASRPEGPFTDKGAPLLCGPGFVNIDPMAYDDPATGKRLLFWGSGFGPIKIQELARDRLSFAPGSTPRDLIQPAKTEDPDRYDRLIEGAWVVRRQGWYYLFFSGDNCCGPKAHYAVMVARSRSATGPYRTLGEETGRGNSVILARDERWIAPGHNAVVQDARGRDWIVYHAVDAKRPRSEPSADVNSRRVMLVDRLVWRNGWPEVVRPGAAVRRLERAAPASPSGRSGSATQSRQR